MNHYKKTLSILILLFLMAMGVVYAESGNQEMAQEKLKNTVFNFDEVAVDIYRSGILSEQSYPLLQEMGIKTVVNFMETRKHAERETAALDSLGIETIWIPWQGLDYPEEADVKQFLRVMKEPKYRPILIHCRRGAERTGLMIACWRVAEEGWSAEKALAEMKARHFRSFWYGHLTKYLFEFAEDYGQSKGDSNTIWSKAKTQVLYSVYRLRKLIPFTT